MIKTESSGISVTISEDGTLTSFHIIPDQTIVIDNEDSNIFTRFLRWFKNKPVKPYIKTMNLNTYGQTDTFLDDNKSIPTIEAGVKIEF